MIALYIAAASIVAVAVALLVARTPAKLRTADQRGITLQTLIVTAVLVLMAGAAGVVIIAITNNAQDNLEGQNSGIDARCEPWEIFDPTLDAAGRGGGNGGIDSSASGCVRVCYLEHTNDNKAASTITTVVENGVAADNSKAILRFSRPNISQSEGTSRKVIIAIDGLRSDTTDDLTGYQVEGGSVVLSTNNPNWEIEVAPNQRYCRVWNTTDDEELFRSQS